MIQLLQVITGTDESESTSCSEERKNAAAAAAASRWCTPVESQFTSNAVQTDMKRIVLSHGTTITT